MVPHWPSVNKPLFFSYLEPKTPITPPDIIDDVLKAAGDDIQQKTTNRTTVEINPSELKEKNDKLIQKETMETGSVSFILFYFIY
jgi:transcriptional/translational regulatory protein YebC/TACO1